MILYVCSFDCLCTCRLRSENRFFKFFTGDRVDYGDCQENNNK